MLKLNTECKRIWIMEYFFILVLWTIQKQWLKNNMCISLKHSLSWKWIPSFRWLVLHLSKNIMKMLKEFHSVLWYMTASFYENSAGCRNSTLTSFLASLTVHGFRVKIIMSKNTYNFCVPIDEKQQQQQQQLVNQSLWMSCDKLVHAIICTVCGHWDGKIADNGKNQIHSKLN